MSENEIQIAKIETLLDNLNDKIDTLTEKVDQIQNTFIIQTTSKIAVAEEKIKRLESIVYGAISIVFVQAVAMIILFVKK